MKKFNEKEITLGEQCEFLARRLSHLLESDVIHLYDEVDRITGAYKRDIKQLDREYGRWEILKEHLEKQIIDSKAGSNQQYYYKQIYDFMEELERSKDAFKHKLMDLMEGEDEHSNS